MLAVAAAVAVGNVVCSLVHDIRMTELYTVRDFSVLMTCMYKQLLVIVKQDNVL